MLALTGCRGLSAASTTFVPAAGTERVLLATGTEYELLGAHTPYTLLESTECALLAAPVMTISFVLQRKGIPT